jgi:hypothetical protein
MTESWTTETVKAYLEQVIAGNDRVCDERFVAQKEAIDSLTVQVNSLRESRGASTGSSDQSKSLWGYVVGFTGIAIALASLGLRLAGK